MNIEFGKKEKVNFRDLSGGNVFSYCGSIYMKLDVVYHGQCGDFNSVNLISGALAEFCECDSVTKENYSFKIL